MQTKVHKDIKVTMEMSEREAKIVCNILGSMSKHSYNETVLASSSPSFRLPKLEAGDDILYDIYASLHNALIAE